MPAARQLDVNIMGQPVRQGKGHAVPLCNLAQAPASGAVSANGGVSLGAGLSGRGSGHGCGGR